MALESQTYVEYEMRVIVKRPVRRGPMDVSMDSAASWACGLAATSELEREMARAMRVIDGDCEAQIVSAKRGEELA